MKKTKIKIALIIFIILLIILLCFSAGVYAAYLLGATDVSYTKPDGTTVSVKEALDEVYKMSQYEISYYQWSTNSNLTASSSGWTSITNTKSQISQNYTATANGTYYFYAKDASGNVGKTSIKITSIDKNAPTINSALKSTGTTINSISLSLGVAADAGGSGLKKIEWYYGTTNNPTTKAGETAITTAQTATYTVSNLSLVTTYYFKAIVYDVAGNKVSSSVISAKTANPKAEDVSYTPADSNWKVNNVKEALDYFFNK